MEQCYYSSNRVVVSCDDREGTLLRYSVLYLLVLYLYWYSVPTGIEA